MFSYTGVEKKQNNKNGEDQKPNLTLDVMKMSAVVIREYRQNTCPPHPQSGCFETSPLDITMTIFTETIPEPYAGVCY